MMALERMADATLKKHSMAVQSAVCVDPRESLDSLDSRDILDILDGDVGNRSAMSCLIGWSF